MTESSKYLANHWAGAIRAVIDTDSGGRILMSGFPGLVVGPDDAKSYPLSACQETIEGLVSHGATVLVVLVEPDELAPLAFERLRHVCQTHGVHLDFRPISDFGTPDQVFMDHWMQGFSARQSHLAAGGTLAFCCQKGAGRSGLMAALCLMEQGLEAVEAIATTRAYFGPAVETEAQEVWLRKWQSAIRRAVQKGSR